MRFIHSLVQFLLSAPKFPGRDYLIVKLPKWFIKKPTGSSIVPTRFGFKIGVDPLFDQNIENVIYERGVYEQGTTTFIQNELKSGGCFIDVGANIGFLTLAAAAKVGDSGKVYAFEPVTSTADLLRANIDINGFQQIEMHQHALGNENKRAEIFPEKLNRGGASIINKRSETGEEIQIKKLDDLDIVETVHMMKIDVEGFEWEVLKGSEQLIRRDLPVLIVEFSQERNNKGNSFEMIDWLKSIGDYSFYRLKNGKERKSKLVPCISKTVGFPVHDNIICIVH